MNFAAVTWLVLLVVFLAAEASTVTLISLWFAAGALVALLASLTGGGVPFQVFLFLAVSVAAMAAQCGVAWVVACLIYQVGRLIIGG